MNPGMPSDGVVLLGCGDVGPAHEPPPGGYAALIRPTLATGHIRFAQCERLYSERGTLQVNAGGYRHTRLPPRMASVFTDFGFDVVSLAGNHAMDWGEEALLDTMAVLRDKGIQVVGAGRNLEEARKPAIVERKGVRIAFLAYCSVLREGYAAGPHTAGVAPLRVHTYYEPRDFQPGMPPRIVTIPYEEDLQALVQDVSSARKEAHAVAVSLHWGLPHIPRAVADYQPLVAHAAFDAGADIILGHHPLMPKAVEVYKGKVCFYSLNHMVMSYPGPASPVLRAYGAEVEDHPRLPYARGAKWTMVARAVFSVDGIRRVSLLPALIDPELRPETLRPGDPRFDEAMRYLEWVSEGFAHRFTVEGDEVVIRAP